MWLFSITLWLLLCLFTPTNFLTSLGLHQYLLLLIRHYSMSLTIEHLPLLLKYFLADFTMFAKCNLVEWSSTPITLLQIHVWGGLECIRSKIVSESWLFFSYSWNNLVWNSVIIIRIIRWFTYLSSTTLLWDICRWASSRRCFSFGWLILILSIFILLLRLFLLISILSSDSWATSNSLVIKSTVLIIDGSLRLILVSIISRHLPFVLILVLVKLRVIPILLLILLIIA